MTLRINVWSSPRNLSTALMYSFRERADTTVVDEPLYGYYLGIAGEGHPGREEVIRGQGTDGARVVREVILGEYDTPVVFFKQMAKHLVDLDRGFLADCRNVLLTRDPHDMITSFQNRVADVTLDETGFVELAELLDTMLANGEDPIVVDSSVLLRDPARVLTALCARLGLDFDAAMLTWPPGPKPEDGVWAAHWYDRVWASSGWERYRPKSESLLPRNEATYATALGFYERLQPYVLGRA